MKKKIEQDPYASREAALYDKPVPSREYITQTLEEAGHPLTARHIIDIFELTEEEDIEAIHRRLRAMERDGQVVCNRRGAYGLISKMDLITGTVVGHKEGFGFVTPDTPTGKGDLFLSPREMRRVFHGDRVVVRVANQDERGRTEAQVVDILSRGIERVVGQLAFENGTAFVMPEHKYMSQPVLISPEGMNGALEGQVVVVQIETYPSRSGNAIGRVVEILGAHMAPGMEIDVAVRAYNLPYEWSDPLLLEVANLGHEVPESAKHDREDVRHLPFVTIDGEDARDFDDAVYCEALPDGGWKLLVAIADVSHYVAPDTLLDREAFKRGNSVYFPERVIPMLPEILSNELCSLKPAVDRLCMVSENIIKATGEVKKSRFYTAVMHSKARLTYTQVAALLQSKTKTGIPAVVIPNLHELEKLYQALREARSERGAIDFDTQETRIVFGKDRKIKKIIPIMRNDAHRLIEECMLVANVAAAHLLARHKIPVLYRIHEKPSPEKLLELRSFLGEIGLSLGGGAKPKPKDYAVLLNAITGREDWHLIQTVLLRSLSQAMYAPENVGHFGLAFDAYTHFTSPIRRYPDLLTHRAIRHVLAKKAYTEEELAAATTHLTRQGEHCSMTERRADDATRDVTQWLKCEYMLDRVGDTFDGFITGVTGFGVFVELKDIFVEGLVHITALPNDYYHFEAKTHRLVGERSKRTYRLGDKIRVRVARVDLDARKIDFDAH